MGAACADPGPKPHDGARGLPAGIAGRGAREGVHEPQDRALGRRSAYRAAQGPGHAHVRRGGRPCSGTAAAGLAQPQACEGLGLQPARLCVPTVGPSTRWRDNDSRRSGGADTDLARQAGDCPAGAPAYRGGDEVGGGDGASAGQPRQRRARSSAWPTASRSPAHAARCLTRRSRARWR